jgi:hypothetical protein
MRTDLFDTSSSSVTAEVDATTNSLRAKTDVVQLPTTALYTRQTVLEDLFAFRAWFRARFKRRRVKRKRHQRGSGKGI